MARRCAQPSPTVNRVAMSCVGNPFHLKRRVLYAIGSLGDTSEGQHIKYVY